jgi:hypothetical protein
MRETIIDGLQPNEALLTLDFAMKWIPRKARERTVDWYGKRGISFHITHVLALRWVQTDKKALMQHTLVHIFNKDLQVLLIIIIVVIFINKF